MFNSEKKYESHIKDMIKEQVKMNIKLYFNLVSKFAL